VYGYVNATYYESAWPRKCAICSKPAKDYRLDMPAESVDELKHEYPDITIAPNCFGRADVCGECARMYSIEAVWTSMSNYTGD
jgi:hypothetical protein